MAAGLDTRAFRLDWQKNLHFFELDHHSVLQAKEKVLQSIGAQSNCNRHSIGVDLTGAWQNALLQAGFDPQKLSGWLLEGFLFYLPAENLQGILDHVTDWTSSGSRLGFDIINQVVLTSPWTRKWVQMQSATGAPWIGTLDDPKTFLTARGW